MLLNLLILVFLVFLAIALYIHYFNVSYFLWSNKIAFTSNVLDEWRYDVSTKEAIQILYDHKSPRFVELFFSNKPLSRKQYYTQEDIEIFFTPFSELHSLNNHHFTVPNACDFAPKRFN